MPSPQQGRPLKPAKQSAQSQSKSSSRKSQPSGRISAACEACKKRKTRCTGGPPPCQLCESLGTECVIDLSLDMRRRAALQRTIDESKAYQESLSGLFECLRDGDSSVIRGITNSLRRGVSPHELSVIIQDSAQNIRERDADVSPSTESVDDQLHFPTTSSLTGSSSEHSHATTTRTIGKASDNPSKGKGSDDSGSYVALLQRLRTCGNADGSQILRSLIPVSDVEDFLEDPTGSASFTQDSEKAVMGGPEGWSMPPPFIEERRTWHPALQLGEDIIRKHRFAQNVGERKFSSIIHTISMLSRDSTEFDSQEHNETQNTSSTTSQATSETSSQPTEKRDFSYTENSGLLLSFDDSDLCVAHENPALRIRVPIHLVQSLTIPDGSAMCRVYTDYLYAARQMVINGHPLSQFLGPNDDIVVDLLFRQRQREDRWDCSSWACELFRSFTEYDVYVKLANAFFLTRMMKWLLEPTIESYAKLPDMMKPTPIQRQVPHIGAIDLIPIPCIRDAAIANLRDWLTPLGQSRWTVNWPFTERDAMEQDPKTMSTRLTQRFIDHVDQYDNWSVGSSFLTTFPEVAGKVNIHL